MNSITRKDKFFSFSTWAKLVSEQNKDVLLLMLKSDNLLNRVIAKDILKTAGVEINA